MDTRDVRERYIEAFLALEPVTARRIVRDAHAAGMSADELYLEVLAPAMQEIGVRWQRGNVSIGAEHLATTVTTRLLSELAPDLSERTSTAPGLALVVCPAPEQHSLGAMMVADFLEASGWSVDLLTGPTPPVEICRLVRRLNPDLVALSSSLAWHLTSARTTIDLVRQERTGARIVVGGRAYLDVADPAAAVGADAHARTPAELLLAIAA